MKNIKVKDKVFVVDWGKHYSEITKYNYETGKRESVFPINTTLPDYCGVNHHWEYKYEPNLTLKGTVNKRDPRRLVKKIPTYKSYKWEVVEIFKHPKAGEYFWPDRTDNKESDRYTTNNLLLLASTHTDKDWMKCYIVIEEHGVSTLTPEQYADQQFNGFVEANLGKWDRNSLNKRNIPEEIKSVFYDENDRVLFGSTITKGLVSYHYLEGKFSTDGRPIFICSSVLYNGKGNEECPNPELIKPFAYIKNCIEPA